MSVVFDMVNRVLEEVLWLIEKMPLVLNWIGEVLGKTWKVSSKK